MSAESVSEATDEAIERAADALRANAYLDPDGDAAAHGAERLRFMLAHLLDSPEGRRALLDVLQPTPEELGGERIGYATWTDPVSRQPLQSPYMLAVPYPYVECVSVWRFPASERDGS